jgi:type IV pilus assembly protein PilQ
MSCKRTANGATASHSVTRACRSSRRLRHQLLLCLGAVLIAPAMVAHANPTKAVLLTRIGVDAGDEQKTQVRLETNATPRYSVVRSAHPPRLRLDLSNSQLRGVADRIDVGSASLRRIVVRQVDGRRSSAVRVELELMRGAQHVVRRDGATIVVTLRAPSRGRDASARLTSAPTPTDNRVGAAAATGLIVSDIAFRARSDRDEVRIELSERAEHRLESADGQPLLRIAGANLPQRLVRKLDTTAFAGPISAVASYRCAGDERATTAQPQTCVRLQLRADVPHRVRREGRTLIWQVVKPERRVKPAGKPTDKGAAVARTYSFEAPRVAAGRGQRKRRGRSYSGRRIDLDFKDAGIHNILRLLSDVGNVNIITSDAVGGKVTIRMKDVPWDQALDVILRAKGLGQVREGNLIRVAPLADLEKEREAELARQKQIMLLQSLETRLIPLSYAQANTVLGNLRYTLSPRGKVTFDQRTNMVIARDVPSNLDLLERMIRNLDTQTPQVMIEARIVEARTNYSRQIGIQWGTAFTASSATGNSTGLAFPNQVGIGGGVDDPQSPTTGILLGQDANPNFVVNMPAATGLNSGSALGLTLGSVSGNFNLNLRLSAAESTGDIRIVSAPKVTTLDNVEAKIEQGVSIPFSQVSANGVQTAFIDATLRLNVKPHVTADGSIIMKIKVERNEPDFVNTGARGDPTILKKQADTELLVKDGDTAVIGGIYTTRDGQSWQKVPWFAEIPILGWLFKTRRESSDREEVLVFITPRIINRAQSIGR